MSVAESIQQKLDKEQSINRLSDALSGILNKYPQQKFDRGAAIGDVIHYTLLSSYLEGKSVPPDEDPATMAQRLVDLGFEIMKEAGDDDKKFNDGQKLMNLGNSGLGKSKISG